MGFCWESAFRERSAEAARTIGSAETVVVFIGPSDSRSAVWHPACFSGHEGRAMKTQWILRIAAPAVLCAVAGLAYACNDNDTTTAPGSVATVSIDAPQSARSGETFTIDVGAVAVGVNNVHNGRVDVTLPAPLQVISVDSSAGAAPPLSHARGGGAGRPALK